jgi:hypothetical protein
MARRFGQTPLLGHPSDGVPAARSNNVRFYMRADQESYVVDYWNLARSYRERLAPGRRARGVSRRLECGNGACGERAPFF